MGGPTLFAHLSVGGRWVVSSFIVLVLFERTVIMTGVGSLAWKDSDRGQHPPGDARLRWAQHYRFYACATQISSFPIFSDFPGGSDGKVSACNVGDPSSIPPLGRSPGEGNGNPLQYSCLDNPMDGGTW